MKKASTYAVLFFLLLAFSCKDKATITSQLEMDVDTNGLDFKYTGFNSALKKAEQESKPLLIYVTSDNCGPCLKMEREVFTDANVQRFFNSRFICAKIHFEHTGAVTKSSDFDRLNGTKVDFLDLYDVQLAFPTFLIFDNQGNLIQKMTRAMDAKEFIQFGNEVVQP